MSIVSIIIPAYNQSRYLPLAVQSVLAQSMADWEAVIIDDGSTDDTRAVALSFSDPRIHYIYQENHGLSAARNTGIRASTAPSWTPTTSSCRKSWLCSWPRWSAGQFWGS